MVPVLLYERVLAAMEDGGWGYIWNPVGFVV